MPDATKPDIWWDDDGEPLEDWRDVYDRVFDDEVAELWCARRPPNKFVARITLTVDKDGDPDETDAQLFDTRAEAEQAVRDSLAAAKVAAGAPS